jgi:hypothetical protein
MIKYRIYFFFSGMKLSAKYVKTTLHYTSHGDFVNIDKG